MKLIKIPNYEDYRIDALFDCYKWDPQFSDSETLAKFALVLSYDEALEVARLTEALDKETRDAENFINKHQYLNKILQIPGNLSKQLKYMKDYDDEFNIRLMRYDFHPTKDNTWAISEVNSDVPGGFAEGSLLHELAIKYIGNKDYYSINFGDILCESLCKKIKRGGTIMLVHCTSYSDDRQVMQFLGDKLIKLGYKVLYGSSDQLIFKERRAYSILDNHEGFIDGIVRFTPLEWLSNTRLKNWHGYFNTVTPSCNYPIAIYAQSKCFPLVFDYLEENGIKMTMWKRLLPKTTNVKYIADLNDYVYKPVWGRVGEKIAIKDSCSNDEYNEILKDVKKHKKRYILQKKFISKPVIYNNTNYHVCLGSYTVDGKHAGFYARVSKKMRIDSDAIDVPVIIKRRKND